MRNQEYTSIDQTCEHCPVRYRGRVMRLTYFSFHGPVSIISLAQHTPTNHQNSLHDFTSEIFRVTPEVLQQTCCGDTETVPATLYSHPGSEDLVVESRKCKCFRPHLAKLRRTGNDDGPCPCSHQGYECIILYIYIYAYIPTCCWFILDVGRYTYAYNFQDFSLPEPRLVDGMDTASSLVGRCPTLLPHTAEVARGSPSPRCAFTAAPRSNCHDKKRPEKMVDSGQNDFTNLGFVY